MEKISVIGSGTWGSALAMLLARKGKNVTLWSKFEVDSINFSSTLKHPNLPGAVFPSSIKFTANLEEAVKGAEMLVLASPSPFIRENAKEVKNFANPGQIIVCVAKGIEENTNYTMTEVIEDVLGKEYKVAALSGPTHAEEVSIDLPTAIVAASKNVEVAKIVQETFNSNFFRVYTNTDVKTVEIAGATKNIIAIACGISEGLGFGDNAVAAIITRGLAEITRLGLKMGGEMATFLGLSGVGDIVVTATSVHSRNHKAGILLGKGHDLETVKKEVGMVIEGINCLKAAKQLSERERVSMPIVDAIYEIIFNHQNPLDAVKELFNRELKAEWKK